MNHGQLVPIHNSPNACPPMGLFDFNRAKAGPKMDVLGLPFPGTRISDRISQVPSVQKT
jgi:hypothetical protein